MYGASSVGEKNLGREVDPIPDVRFEWAKIAEDITCVAQKVS